MKLNDKKILITGGTGFIGSAIANRLVKEGMEVNILSRSNNFEWRIEDKTSCNFYYADLENKKSISKVIKKIKPNLIFHLAAFVNAERNISIIDDIFSTNFIGTKNLLLALHEFDYDLFINTGTSDEYGINSPPFLEGLRENPTSPYSVSKLAATHFCEMLSKVSNKPIISVRPFLIYGPTQISRSLIPSLIYSGIQKRKLSLTPCEQTRDFLYIEDLVDLYLSLTSNVEKVKTMGIFNAGSGKETKIVEIVNYIMNKFPESKFNVGEKPYRVGETMSFYSSITKIKSVINWTPRWTVTQGLEETINWWKENSEIWKKYEYIWN